VSLDGIAIGEFVLDNPDGGDYDLAISDAQRLALYTAGVFDDLLVDVSFDFAEGWFRYATADDFDLEPNRTHWGFGIAAPALATGATVPEPRAIALAALGLLLLLRAGRRSTEVYRPVDVEHRAGDVARGR